MAGRGSTPGPPRRRRHSTDRATKRPRPRIVRAVLLGGIQPPPNPRLSRSRERVPSGKTGGLREHTPVGNLNRSGRPLFPFARAGKYIYRGPLRDRRPHGAIDSYARSGPKTSNEFTNLAVAGVSERRWPATPIGSPPGTQAAFRHQAAARNQTRMLRERRGIQSGREGLLGSRDHRRGDKS
jgi:hypothetical protein